MATEIQITARNAKGSQIGATELATSHEDAVLLMRRDAYALKAIDGFTVEGFGIVRATRDAYGVWDGGFSWLDARYGFLTGDFVDLRDALDGIEPAEAIRPALA